MHKDIDTGVMPALNVQPGVLARSFDPDKHLYQLEAPSIGLE